MEGRLPWEQEERVGSNPTTLTNNGVLGVVVASKTVNL